MSRINSYTEIPDKSGLSSDDYLVVDGDNNGTRKIKARSLIDVDATYTKIISVDDTAVNTADDRTARYWWRGKGFVYFPCYDNVIIGGSVCQYLMANSGQLKVRKGTKTGNHTYSWDSEWTVIGENSVVKGLRNLIPDSTYSGENHEVSTYLSHAAYSASDYTNTSIPSSVGSVPYHYDIPNGFNVSVSSEGRAIEVYDSISGTVYQTPVTPGSNYIIRNLIPYHLCTYNVLDQDGYVIQYGSIKDTARVRMIYPGVNNEQTDPYNIRDLGGWSCDGGRLKYGVIYRGSELFSVVDRSDGTTFTPNVSLSDTQKKFFVNFLGIKDEIDFHRRGTMDSKGAQLASDVGYLNVPLNHYQNIFRNEKVQVRTIITRIADDIHAGKPVYMHCQAGADRTAVISMIIEAICGVSQNDCDTDYELSSYSCRYNIPVDISQSGAWQANRRARNTGAGYASWREMMTGFVSSLSGSTLKDKIIGYLLTIGVTIDDINAIRHGLIDGEPAVLTAGDFASITGASEYAVTINTNGNIYINEAIPAQSSLVMQASAYSPLTIKISRAYANYDLDTLTVAVSNYIPSASIVSDPCGNDPYFNPGTGVLTIPSVTGPVTINVSAINRFSKRPEVWQTESSYIDNPDGDNTYDINGTSLASMPMYSFVWHTGLKILFKETSRSGTVSTLSPVFMNPYSKEELDTFFESKADSDVVKPLFTKIIEDSCDSETLTRYNVLENKKIVSSGGAANDENYDIDRYYPLTPGTLLKIKATADSNYTYQFQRTTSMGSANLVSGPFSGDVDDFVIIPDNAVCLSICRSKTNTTNSVTLYSPILPDVSESVTKKLNAPIVKQSSLAPDVTVSDKLYDFLTFSEYPLSGSAYSDFSVQQGNVYMISGKAGQNALHYCLGGFFDASDNLLQSFGTEIVQGGKIYTDFVVTAPSEAVKVRVNSGKVSTSPILCFSADYDMDCIPALRQVVAENTEATMISNKMLGVIPFETKIGFYKADGSLASDNRYECGVAILDVTQGEKYLYKGKGGGNAVSVILYDSSDEIVSTEQWSATDYHEVVIPSGVTKALFTSMRVVASDPVLMFELYKTGGIYNLYKKANPQDSAPRTLNLTNRLYAAETMGVSRQVDLPQGKAVFCVGFDDYNLDCLEAVQYLAEQGLPSYLALIPNNVTDDWAMARLCYENGGEIVAHSGTVLTDQNQTFELMNDKFVDIPVKIGEAGFPVYGIIRAGGTDQGKENTLLDEFYCRASGLKYSDYYGKSPQYTLGRTSLLSKSVSEWETYLDDLATNGGFCIAFCHHVNGTEAKYKYTETGFKLEDHFKPIMAHAKSLMNNPSYDFEIITINEFVDRYVYKTESFDQDTQKWTHSSDGFVR